MPPPPPPPQAPSVTALAPTASQARRARNLLMYRVSLGVIGGWAARSAPLSVGRRCQGSITPGIFIGGELDDVASRRLYPPLYSERRGLFRTGRTTARSRPMARRRGGPAAGGDEGAHVIQAQRAGDD